MDGARVRWRWRWGIGGATYKSAGAEVPTRGLAVARDHGRGGGCWDGSSVSGMGPSGLSFREVRLPVSGSVLADNLARSLGVSFLPFAAPFGATASSLVSASRCYPPPSTF